MRTYQLYLIDDEFASHYFGKERLCFQLFNDYNEAVGELKYIAKKQIDFITKPIQALKIHQFVNQHLQKNRSFYISQGVYTIRIGRRSFAELEVQERCLIIRASGHYEAETIFFEVLRKAESSFLAIDLKNRYGAWLKPIKERKFV